MSFLKIADARKLDKKARAERLKELRLELMKTGGASKNKTKTKEIKKAIARLLTLAQADKNQRGQTQ